MCTVSVIYDPGHAQEFIAANVKQTWQNDQLMTRWIVFRGVRRNRTTPVQGLGPSASCLSRTRATQCWNSKNSWQSSNCCTGTAVWRRCANATAHDRKCSHTILTAPSTTTCAHRWRWIGSRVSRRFSAWSRQSCRRRRMNSLQRGWPDASWDSRRRRGISCCWHSVRLLRMRVVHRGARYCWHSDCTEKRLSCA